MSLRWFRVSSLQFSGPGQAGIVHIGFGQRVLTVVCEISRIKNVISIIIFMVIVIISRIINIVIMIVIVIICGCWSQAHSIYLSI